MSLILTFVVAYAFSAKARPRITGIRIVLPPSVHWKRVLHSTASVMYVDAWVPKEFSSKNSPWQILSTRMPFDRHITALRYSRYVVGRYERDCNHPDIDKFKKIVVSGYTSYTWEMTCTGKTRETHDAIRYFRVVSGFRSIYLIISRLYLPSSSDAGSKSTNKSLGRTGKILDRRKAASEKMVTSGIIVCVLGQRDC